MNPLIKRSMMLALSLVFIGAAVVPACAQNKKGIIKGATAFLGKKPPLTGTLPVVKPVTPSISPTLQGAVQILSHVVPNEALDAAVERKVATANRIPQYIPDEPELMVALYDIGEAHGRPRVFLDLAWITKIFELTDETVFLKTGKFVEANVNLTSYEKTWLYVKNQICKELKDNERFEIYLSKDSPLKNTFELRQRQLNRFLQNTH